jgi:zinc/manganese transport system permease protein
VVIGFLVTWAGLTAAFYSPYPIGFWVTSFAFAVYLAAQAAPALLRYRAAHLAGAPA